MSGLWQDAPVLTHDERNERLLAASAAPKVHSPSLTHVFHYSEDGNLRRFAPHVPPSNPSQRPAVWTIDAAHSPLYWFPRDCPRISVWAYDDAQQTLLSELFDTEAKRICAAETGWVQRIASAHVYRYTFDAAHFSPWEEADGQYISTEVEFPTNIDRIDDLMGMHAAHEIELRFTPRLGNLMDAMLASGLPFSLVRIRDAAR